MLLNGILSNLSGRCTGDRAYNAFAREWCGGTDPMDTDEWEERIWKLAYGEEGDFW